MSASTALIGWKSLALAGFGVGAGVMLAHFFPYHNSDSEEEVKQKRVRMAATLRESAEARRTTFSVESGDKAAAQLGSTLDELLTPVENAVSLLGAMLDGDDLREFDKSIIRYAIDVMKLDATHGIVPYGLLESLMEGGIKGAPGQLRHRSNLSSVDDIDEVDAYLLAHYSQLQSHSHRHHKLKSLAIGIAFAMRMRQASKKKIVVEPVDATGPFQFSLDKWTEITEVLKGVDDWDFDIFALHAVSGGMPLRTVGWYIFKEWDLLKEFHIDQEKFKNWLAFVEASYFEVPYHNSTHAADVLQTVHWILKKGGAASYLARIEILAVLCAAVAHDVGHDGKNNDFHKHIVSDRAISFNDRSIQENYHASTIFRAMKQDPSIDIFGNLNDEQAAMLRSTMIEMILMTDMSRHFEKLTAFKSVVEEVGQTKDRWENHKIVLLDLLLHSADISNQAKHHEMASKWTDCALSEFFAQGDEEKKRGLPQSQLCNREVTHRARSQIKFIKYIVLPTYTALGELLPAVRNEIVPRIHENLFQWNLLNRPVLSPLHGDLPDSLTLDVTKDPYPRKASTPTTATRQCWSPVLEGEEENGQRPLSQDMAISRTSLQF